MLLVDNVATVTICSDAGSASARHDAPPRLKAEIVGIVMDERKRKGVRRRNRDERIQVCVAAYIFTTALPVEVSQALAAVVEPAAHINAE
jgi:hypothetical protein